MFEAFGRALPLPLAAETEVSVGPAEVGSGGNGVSPSNEVTHAPGGQAKVSVVAQIVSIISIIQYRGSRRSATLCRVVNMGVGFRGVGIPPESAFILAQWVDSSIDALCNSDQIIRPS